MTFQAVPMTVDQATAILKWTYPPPYDFYNMEPSEEAYAELLDGSYQAVIVKKQLVGFFCTGQSAQVPPGRSLHLYPDDHLDIGLGRQPELTGQGTGFIFCSFILDTVKAQSTLPLRLTVASFNERAIHLYEQLGFQRHATFWTTHATFLIMMQSHT